MATTWIRPVDGYKKYNHSNTAFVTQSPQGCFHSIPLLICLLGMRTPNYCGRKWALKERSPSATNWITSASLLTVDWFFHCSRIEVYVGFEIIFPLQDQNTQTDKKDADFI